MRDEVLLNSILEHFDPYEILPIEVNTVRDQILEMGIQDEIRFYFVDIKEDILRGLIYRYRKSSGVYADPVFCTDICIAQSLSDDWKRLVAVKELLHITDTDRYSAESEQAVDALIERMSKPVEIRDISNETNSSMNDRLLYIAALAILVPKECRLVLRRLVNESKITYSEIAKMAGIPERYADYVIDEGFESIVEIVLKIHEETD